MRTVSGLTTGNTTGTYTPTVWTHVRGSLICILYIFLWAFELLYLAFKL
jgi:hypothetical protein